MPGSITQKTKALVCGNRSFDWAKYEWTLVSVVLAMLLGLSVVHPANAERAATSGTSREVASAFEAASIARDSERSEGFGRGTLRDPGKVPQEQPALGPVAEEEIKNLILKLKEALEGATSHSGKPTPGVGPLTEILVNFDKVACGGAAVLLSKARNELSQRKFESEAEAALNQQRIQQINEILAKLAEACDEHRTHGPQPPPPPPAPLANPPPPDHKKEVDYKNIEKQCDPDGKLRDDIAWHQRRLEDQLEKPNPDQKSIDFRREELKKLRGKLCPCLDKLKSLADKMGDTGMQELLKDLISRYCVPPAEHRTAPPPQPPTEGGGTTQKAACADEKEAYEKARQNYLDGGGNSPGQELTMARAKNAYCNCMRRKYGNKLPPEVEKFCDPKTRRTPSKAPNETAMAPAPPANSFKSQTSLVGVVIPADTQPNDTITATVVSDPKSYENIPAVRVVEVTVPLAIEEAGKTSLHGVVVDMGDGPPKPADTPLVYKVPSDAPSIPVVIKREDDPKPGSPTNVPIETKTTKPSKTPSRYETPAAYVETALQVVTGKFGGDANYTQIEMAGRPADVIAETPRAVYWKIPEGTAPGSNRVVVRDGETTVTFNTAVLRLDMNANRLTLKRGETTSFSVAVSGFDGLPDSAWRAAPPSDTVDVARVMKLAPGFHAPKAGDEGVVLLTIQNGSPRTVTIDGAKNDVIVLPIARKDVKNGKYEYHGTIRSKQAGGFTVNGSLAPFLAPVAGESR